MRSAVLLLACTCMAFAARPVETYHQDHRSNLVKLDFVAPQLTKNINLEGEALAENFLATHANRYGLDANLGDLSLADVKQSLVGTHYHYEQYLGEHKIHRAEIIVSISHEDGSVYMVYNNTYPVGPTKRLASAELEGEDAYDASWQALRVHGELMAPPSSQLVYIPEGENFRLVYLVELAVEAPFGYWETTVDAELGDVIDIRRTTISRIAEEDVDFDEYDGELLDRHAAFQRYAAKEANRQVSASKAAADGTGQVFDPDPVTALQNSNLSDSSPASSFNSAYVSRTLKDLDLTGGVYRLNGPWVNIQNFESPNTAPTTSTSGNWNYTRGNNGFNDAMTYFHIDQSQRYMQSLGFTGSTGIQYGSINADSDGASGADNSYYQPSGNRVTFGHGCVDDNEDAFVILHEYGHAIHHSINSNWSGGDTGGMGEGFGDYWAGSYKYRTPNGSFNPNWAFPWDGHNSCWGGRDMDQTSFQYDPTKSYPAHSTVGGVYSDELWSTPLFQALVTLTGQGVNHGEVDQVILQAHFGLGSGLSMRDMANAIVNTASSLYPSGNHATVFRQKFEAQNILTPSGGNQAPNAAFSHSTSGLTASFTDSSSDSDGTIASRSWNFGDGSSSSATNPSHTYSSAGTYTVTLTVTDNDGATDSTSSSVTVSSGGGGSELENGDTVTGLSGSTGEWRYYTVNIPSGASNLNISISGGSGDADLYTRFGSQPTTSSYDCRPYVGGNNESCPVASPSVGTYHIGIRAYSSYSNVSLSVSWDEGGSGCTPGSNNQSGLSGSSGTWKHFTINVPSCATNLTVTMSGGSGDADLYTRFGAQPTTSNYSCRPYSAGNNEDCSVSNPSAGTWYISVRGYSSYSGVNLTISYD